MQGYGMGLAAYVLVMAGVLGAVMGSFINCWAWRAMHGESILEGHSHCTACGHALGPLDLVPVFSWLFSGGRCRYCKEPVSARYPATELVSAACFSVIVWRYGLTLETAELLAFACVLLFLSLTDIDDYLIPNTCIVVAVAIRVVYLVVSLCLGTMGVADVLYYVLSALGVAAVLVGTVLVADKVLGKESMGGGDLKLFFVAALYVGWQQSLFLVFASCIIGIVMGTVVWPRIQGGAQRAEELGIDARAFPFGPSIAMATIVTLLCGGQVISWYLGLFG
jgi:leader peptidase (prepilin peptidase)/N-methyltransferase